jgi:hypothetical protein
MWRPLALLFLLLFTPTLEAKDAGDPRERTFPVGWSVAKEAELPKVAVDGIGTRLGATLERITARTISINGYLVQLNYVTCPSEEDARAAHEALARMRGGLYFRRVGRELIEVTGTNVLVTKRIWAALALGGQAKATHVFEAPIGLIDTLDYMTANPVFNQFLRLERGTGNAEETEQAILEITKAWGGGSTKWLLTGGTPDHAAVYEFEPKPHKTKQDGWRTQHTFATPPGRLGVPHVQLRATVTVRARFTPSVHDKSPGSTAATPAWPAEDEKILAAMRELTSGRATPREKVLSILRFVSGSVKTGGPMGSRHGTRKVLAQRFGHCWDKSDLLITLCRAAGLPARQVAGWVPPLNAGHVWAEVRLGDAGWIPVDATTTWLGTSEDYIPLYGTSDGEMPIVYLGWPKISRRP